MYRRLLPSLVVGLVIAPACLTAPPPRTPAQTLQALKNEVDQARAKLDRAYPSAKTPAAQHRLFDDYYTVKDACAGRALALAKKYPHDPAAFDALEWIIAGGIGWSPSASEALDIVRRDFVRDKRLGKITSMVSTYCGVYSRSAAFLHDVMAKNPDRQVQAQAAYGLAELLYTFAESADYMRKHPKRVGSSPIDQRILTNTPEQWKKQAEASYQVVIDKYAGIKAPRGTRTLAQRAESTLFEMRHLQVGQTAPEIVGEDVDGHRFKLSDYRGKVVLLDFWGNW
jgi:hypothetical protein